METLLITRADVRACLPLADCIAAVEKAFCKLAEGRVPPPATLASHCAQGAFHIKAGQLGRYFAAKTNGNFPGNPLTSGLPTIQGVVLLCDADNGRVLALMDSIELTARRTAAATAIAARILARPDARVLAIVGCGVQAAAHLDAMSEVMELERVIVYDSDHARARAFARSANVEVADHLTDATLESDVIVTCTTSKEFFLYPEHVRDGTFIGAVGVDNELKREIAPALMRRAIVVTDATMQCAQIGDLHHAIDAGVMKTGDVWAELPALVAGGARGRTSQNDIIVFDSTGIGLQDVAAAACVYENALNAARALRTIDFA
jgi:alanine dehydrogenase